VVNQPVQQLNSAIFNVAFPALSRIQHDAARLCRSFLKGYSIQLSINVPITICTALFAGEIIRVLLGRQWLEASPALVLLAPAMLGFSLINPLGWFMMATGRAARSLRIAYLVTPTVILGILLGVPYGFKGVAVGFSTAVVALVFPIVIWALHGSGITLREYFSMVKLPLLAGLLAGVCGWLIKHAVGSALPPVAILFVGSGLVCTLYAFLLLIVFGQKPMYLDLAQQVLRRKSRANEEPQIDGIPI
jgi:PST family polysaccharide transporter